MTSTQAAALAYADPRFDSPEMVEAFVEEVADTGDADLDDFAQRWDEDAAERFAEGYVA